MKHAVIFAHPRARSFTAEMANAYAGAIETLGGEVVIRDLYRIHFDPRLHMRELPDARSFRPMPDVVAEREQLADVDCFALFYPLWFNGPPAMMKGYIDRVFSQGFGYAPIEGEQTPRLAGRGLFSVTSSGAPEDWLRETGASKALHTLVDDHLAAVCGLTVIDHIHFGGVVPGYPSLAMEASSDTVRTAVTRHFEPRP